MTADTDATKAIFSRIAEWQGLFAGQRKEPSKEMIDQWSAVIASCKGTPKGDQNRTKALDFLAAAKTYFGGKERTTEFLRAYFLRELSQAQKSAARSVLQSDATDEAGKAERNQNAYKILKLASDICHVQAAHGKHQKLGSIICELFNLRLADTAEDIVEAAYQYERSEIGLQQKMLDYYRDSSKEKEIAFYDAIGKSLEFIFAAYDDRVELQYQAFEAFMEPVLSECTPEQIKWLHSIWPQASKLACTKDSTPVLFQLEQVKSNTAGIALSAVRSKIGDRVALQQYEKNRRRLQKIETGIDTFRRERLEPAAQELGRVIDVCAPETRAALNVTLARTCSLWNDHMNAFSELQMLRSTIQNKCTADISCIPDKQEFNKKFDAFAKKTGEAFQKLGELHVQVRQVESAPVQVASFIKRLKDYFKHMLNRLTGTDSLAQNPSTYWRSKPASSDAAPASSDTTGTGLSSGPAR